MAGAGDTLVGAGSAITGWTIDAARSQFCGFLRVPNMDRPRTLFASFPRKVAEQHPLVSEALVGISVSVRSTATLLEVLVTMKLAPISRFDPASE